MISWSGILCSRSLPSKPLKKSEKSVRGKTDLDLSAKKMTDSLIDVGQSSKKFATKVEEEAINEKMKVLEVNKKAEESVTACESSDSVAAFTSQSSKGALSSLTRFRAEIRGFDSGDEKFEEALREHFKECGNIDGISVNGVAGYAHIDFTSLVSLYKALELNTARVGGHPVTVRQLGFNFRPSKFKAVISRFHDTDLKALRQHFETCGGIVDMSCGPTCVYIDFTNLDSLNKALELDNTTFDNHRIAVKKCITACCIRCGSVA